ncbi:MAG: hypothetical protein HY804_04935 [Nitrospinae bacterium]|nr:hypothetical protein [Nitrospinota bacterium]
MDVKRGFLIRRITGFAVVAALAALAACSDSGGDGDSGSSNDFGSIARASIGSITINPGETATVKPSAQLNRKAAFTQGGGYVNAVTFDSDQPIVIMRMGTSGADYFDCAVPGSSCTGILSVAYFYNWAWSSSDTTQTLVMPPMYTLADLFPSGDYEFKLYNAGSGAATVNVYQTRKNDSNFSSGQIDLNFFVYRAGEDNPVIPSQAEAEKVVGYINDIFGQVGVSVGTLNVEFIDDTNAVNQVLDDNGMEAFLAQASRATSGRGDKGINCFILPRRKGADYLMFWVFDTDLVYSGNAQTTLSPMEGQLINTFPSVN